MCFIAFVFIQWTSLDISNVNNLMSTKHWSKTLQVTEARHFRSKFSLSKNNIQAFEGRTNEAKYGVQSIEYGNENNNEYFKLWNFSLQNFPPYSVCYTQPMNSDDILLTILTQLSQSHRGWHVIGFSLLVALVTSLLAPLVGWFQCRRNLTIPRSPSVPAFSSFLINRSTLDCCTGEVDGAKCCCFWYFE